MPHADDRPRAIQDRLDQLEERIKELEAAVSFLAQFIQLSRLGHTTAKEHGALSVLAESTPRCSYARAGNA